MGRYYSGSIEGKFWFGVQSSNDVENLISITSNPPNMSWIGCGCHVEYEEDGYCLNCYNSLEEFLDKEGDSIEGGIHYYEDSELIYQIDESSLEELNKSLTNIEKDFDENMKKLCETLPIDLQNAANGQFDEIIDYMEKHKIYDEKIIARYCLGRQIKYSLETDGFCNLYCEL